MSDQLCIHGRSLDDDCDKCTLAIRNGDDMAYPIDDGVRNPAFGLTKRELFAAMAMQGAMAAYGVHAEEFDEDTGRVDPKAIAKDAVKMADALLMELSR